MLPSRLALIIFLVSVLPTRAGVQIPQPVLDKLKAATVFIKVGTGPIQETGTGFLIKCEGNKDFVVTNRHVLAMGVRAEAGQQGKSDNKVKIEVVFNSGQTNERAYKAELVAFHTIGNLALLKLVDAKGLPEPLDFKHGLKFMETLPVHVLGFPFGADLPKSGRHPAVTLSRGTVSSFREHPIVGPIIQLDAELNEGHSGGPIVDVQGRLIGIAAIGIDGTKIGFAIPATQITKLLEPRVSQLTLKTGTWLNGKLPVHCAIETSDPLEQIQEVALLYSHAENGLKLRKGPGDNTWPELPNSKSTKLVRTGGKITGTFQLSKTDSSLEKYQIQVLVTFSDKSVARSEALHATIGASRTEIFPPNSQVLLAFGRVPSLVERSTELARPKAIAAPILAGEFRFDVPPTPEGEKREANSSPCCWSSDGKWLYSLSHDGTLRKLSCPGLKEEAALQTGLKTWLCLSLSAAGLVVSGRTDPGDASQPPFRVVLVNSDTLKPIRTIGADARGRFHQTVASQNSSFAYAVCLAPSQLIVIDLAKGEIAKKYPADTFGFPEPSLHPLVISPDGQWIVTRDHTRLFRFRLNGADVKFEEASPKILQSSMPEVPVISYDGKWIRATCENRQYGQTIDGRSGYSTQLFSMESLAKPAQSLAGVQYPLFAAFDRATGHVYINSLDYVDVFDPQGNHLGRHNIAGALQRKIGRMLVHPEGRYLACWLGAAKNGSEGIALVELSVPASPNTK